MTKNDSLQTKKTIDLAKISGYEKKINEITKLSEATVIENDEGLEIAKGNLKQAKDIKKAIDKERKALGDPFREVVEHVNSTAKYYIEKIDIALSNFNTKVVAYANIAKAQREAEEAAELARVRAEAESKETVIEKYIRLRTKMYAYLIGGQWMEKGLLNNNNGCKTSEDVNKLHSAVSKTFPKAEEFGHLAKESRTLLASFAARCAQLIAIKKSTSMSEQEKETAMDSLRTEITDETNSEMKALGVALQKETKLETKRVEENITSVSKGIRHTLKFEVIDESKVARQLMMVDDRKVNSFIRKHGDKIKNELKAGNQPLEGIRFYIDQVVL